MKTHTQWTFLPSDSKRSARAQRSLCVDWSAKSPTMTVDQGYGSQLTTLSPSRLPISKIRSVDILFLLAADLSPTKVGDTTRKSQSNRPIDFALVRWQHRLPPRSLNTRHRALFHYR